MQSAVMRKSRAKSKIASSPSKTKQAMNAKKLKSLNSSSDKQLKVKQELFEKQQICSLASTKQKYEYQQSPSEENSLQNSERQKSSKIIYPCVCARTFVMRKRFQNHLKAVHSYHLMSSLYCEIRDKYEQENIEFLDHYEEHRNTINLIILSKDGNYSIPQEMLQLFKENLIQKAKKKLKKSQIDLNDFGSHQKISEKASRIQILSLQFLNSLKQQVIEYIGTYERRMKVYLKNAPLSHLFHVFLINFLIVSSRIDQRLKTKNMFLRFETTLKSFQNFVNQNYKDCFQRAQLFFNHINLRSYQTYCEKQRSWKIDVLIRAYLQQLCHRKTPFNCFQLSKFLLCAFQEFVISNDLQV